ncbi:MAG: hypothetical protein QGG40_14065, partial [Myxococcota bacterium]|nr:hypothetical protein [Myxococcota bacterium]
MTDGRGVLLGVRTALLTLGMLGSAWAGPVSLSGLVNTDLVTEDGSAEDAVCLRSREVKDLPILVKVPIQQAGSTLVLSWLTNGQTHIRGNAAMVRLVFADGREAPTVAVHGEHISALGSATQQSTPRVVGTGQDGRPVVASQWALATGRPTEIVDYVEIVTRTQDDPLCITAMEMGEDPFSDLVQTDTEDWYTFLMGPILEAPLPQAIPVEAPAGLHGFTTVDEEGHLVFEDGTRARFWGVDTYKIRALPPKDKADDFARTLAALGFNMVRLPHIDHPETGLVNQRRKSAEEPLLVPEMVDRLDFFLSRLKAHGLYFFLETTTHRTYTAADGVNNPGGAL